MRIQTRQDLERQLAGSGEEAARLEREAENLEGQVEQLTIALMDATSKRTDSELRLRQFQQVRPPAATLASPRASDLASRALEGES